MLLTELGELEPLGEDEIVDMTTTIIVGNEETYVWDDRMVTREATRRSTTTDRYRSTMSRYELTVEKDACDGIFACLTRDPRFVEG